MWSVIGHFKQKTYFEAVLKNGSLGHAYLFSGLEMIGKKKFAGDLFRIINGRDATENDPDFKLISPRVLEGETKIYIDDVREIKSFLSLKPFYGPYKFVIIDNADRMTLDASNAILKTLEEPAAHSILVLVTANPKLLLLTVLSRCETMKFLPQKENEITELVKQKNYKTGKEDLNFLLKLANGRIGWAVNVLETNSLNEIQKSTDDFRQILKQGVFEKMQFAKKIYENDEYTNLVGQWLNWAYSFNVGDKKLFRGLLRLNQLLSQPQFNHRLAIENFLVNL